MAKGSILLVEDDPNLGLVVQEHLRMNGYEVVLCADGQAATEAAGARAFDICLIDVMLPKLDGFSFSQHLRRIRPDTPFIFLTARSLTEDKIHGFKLGCDDYVTKPFSIEELLLRIEVVLKRLRNVSDNAAAAEFQIGSFYFDHTRSLLLRGDEQQKLTTREADLLRLLCLHVNRTLNREDALKEIWGDDSYFTGRSMDVYISKLRKYLKDDPSIEIMSIHGKGFRLVVS